MPDERNYPYRGGLFVGADGHVYDATKGMSDTGLTADPLRYPYQSGMFVDEDGNVVDITKLFGSGNGAGAAGRVTALNGELIAENVVEAVGAPAYVSAENIANFADFGITEAGWYVFAKVQALGNTKVGSAFSITGAEGHIAPAVGDNSVDVAVKFAVASISKVVTINWDGQTEEKFNFRATDLAIRNLDYRVTYYLYDFSAYATFTFAAATGTFASGKKYFTLVNGEYVEAENVTVGASIPAGYYVHSGVRFEGFVRNVSYSLAETVDCPITLVLPDIIDDKYGAWFEVQTTFDAAHSITLIAPDGVTISKDMTITPKAGVNVINAQYHAGSAMWRVNCTTWDAPHA